MKEAAVVWKEGMNFSAAGREGVILPLSVDGPGFTPMELVLVGLAGCTGMDVVTILQKKRQSVSALTIETRGEQAPDDPHKYIRIQVKFILTGHQIDPQAVQRAIELSDTKYCSVAASLRGVAEITTTFEIREADAPAAEEKDYAGPIRG